FIPLFFGGQRAADVVGGDQALVGQRHHPHAALAVPRLVGAHAIALAPPRDQVGYHLALCADHGRASCGGDFENAVPGGLAVLGVRLLGEQRFVVDGGAEFLGQRRECLMAAHSVGGVERVGAEGEQHSDERLGLSAAVLV